ncbi:transposase [Tenacibaculum sp. 190524A02b]
MIVDLMLSGQKAENLGVEYDIHPSTIRKWRQIYLSGKEPFTGSGNVSLTPQEKEIRRLKKQLKETELERDILKKVVSIFSKNDGNNIPIKFVTNLIGILLYLFLKNLTAKM